MSFRARVALASAALFLPLLEPSRPVVLAKPASPGKSGALVSLGLFLMERDMVALPAGVARNASRSFRRKLLGSTAATAVPK